MCGIVGYIGKRDAISLLVDSLKRLEYRGYDSAGIACQNGKGLEIFKTRGKIKDLQQILPDTHSEIRVGLGHTRWATHGEPSTRNAHPHVAGGVAVVHNGIIENYRELRSQLAGEGCQLSSDTDTEVIPHMISKNLKRGLPLKDAIEEALLRLRGTFALGIMSEANPYTLFAVRKGSPLVVSLGEGEFFFASDIPAILPYSRKFIFLEDGQLCRLSPDGLDLHCMETGRCVSVDERITDIAWTPSLAEKDGFDHFMLKEIYEQPRTVADTFAEWVKEPRKLLEESGLTPEVILGLRRVHIVACGTSYHAGLIGKYLIEGIARIPVTVEIASEYRYKKPITERGTFFISITQSGETADTLAAQREVKQIGATTCTICNVLGSSSSREADFVLYTRAGPEIGVASTKAFTAQITVLYLFAVSLAAGRGKLGYKEECTLISHLLKIPDLLKETLKKEGEIRELAGTLMHAKNFLYLGRGINYPVALEGALKLKEISYIHAEGYAAGEMKHGPIALIEEGLPVVVVAPKDNLFEKIFSNIEEVKARGGRVIAVTDSVASLAGNPDDLLEVPTTHHTLFPFVAVIPLQLLAYHISVMRGCDVDQPRNLAKSVTVE
jgi:glucosamine--fructose-6-phosphate aminotransferase (isomerizing)